MEKLESDYRIMKHRWYMSLTEHYVAGESKRMPIVDWSAFDWNYETMLVDPKLVPEFTKWFALNNKI